MEKKKPAKKSLPSVRPQPAVFTLESMQGIELRFRKPSIDDTAWCEATFGKDPREMISQKQASTADLCRLYFHYLDIDSKSHFGPKEFTSCNDETGEVTTETVGGWRRLMREITGGVTEVLLIANAFAATLFSFRAEADFSDEEKKTLKTVLDAVSPAAKTETQEAEAPGEG